MIYTLMEFAERVTLEAKQTFIKYDYMYKICEALEDLAAGTLPTLNLGINIAPRTYKTYFASLCFTAWCFGEIAPDCEFILTSSTAGLAEGNSRAVKDILSKEWYKELYPHVTLQKSTEAKNTQKYFKTHAQGSVYGVGFDGTITGFGAGKSREGFGGCVNIDDPIKANARHYPAQIKKCIKSYTGTIDSRKNNVNTPTLNIMQRICEGDLSGWLREEDGENWTWVTIKARENGKVINPTTMSNEKLDKIQQYDPDTYNAQYMQDDTKSSERMFKKEYWRYWENREDLPPMRSINIYGDTALKAKEKNDYSVLQTWGLGTDNFLYLLDQVRGKWLSPELRRQTIAYWEKWRVQGATSIKIEDKASGTDVICSLQEYGIPIVGIPRNSTLEGAPNDKYSRQCDAVPYIGSGNVYIPKYAPWIDGYVNEFWDAPNGDFDDQIDPTLDAIFEHLAGGTYDYSTMV